MAGVGTASGRKQKKDLARKASAREPSDRVCLVCQDVILKHTCIHYGGLSCYSCRAFFRRANQESKKAVFECKYDRDCEITVKTRRKCQRCRYDLCLKAGMKPENVLTPDQKVVRFRKKRQKQTKVVPSPARSSPETSSEALIVPKKERLTILEPKSPERPFTNRFFPEEQPTLKSHPDLLSQQSNLINFGLPDIGDNIEDLLSNMSSEGDSNSQDPSDTFPGVHLEPLPQPVIQRVIQPVGQSVIRPNAQSVVGLAPADPHFINTPHLTLPLDSDNGGLGGGPSPSPSPVATNTQVDWFNHHVVEQKHCEVNYLVNLLNHSGGVEH
ncbi:hypothetical protein TCAL_08929 [Tigriopus californicus]|uniref:Nuclear receptor domain-containing protein n=1 Tax=Tigriopus californicus TaxID=6832 RepID=A0A553PP55_TIGCA|nr:vitamin D3 receptor-like [Tigriopus californicus]TRY79464.1 hypothetical protein TCAL_08929 [Tigriopus californicus]|eukprot:TCALIF_08929-PA protein Name:"Similar to EcR Ecdysone receptor (Drosophila melanogaster)" AED:0.42 eAED:0.44 QI:0/-1/0/1/-1/1/1/0/326